MKYFAYIICFTVLTALLNLSFTNLSLAANESPEGAEAPKEFGIDLKNPLAFDSIQDLLVGILNVLIIIATPIVVFFIILAGFKFVTAQGNTEKLTEARRALLYAIIGGVLIIGAVAISEIIANLVTAFRS